MRVIEGHQLQGNDIKPVVTVLIGQHRFRTRIRVGNNPYYNEVTPGGGDMGTRRCPLTRPHLVLPISRCFAKISTGRPPSWQRSPSASRSGWDG